MKMFEVGGCVRDEILGRSSKDIDFTVVLEDSDFPTPGTSVVAPDPFSVMRGNLVRMGFEIFVETPEHLTIRAKFPKANRLPEPWASRNGFTRERSGLTADFVLARKEGDYSDGRRPDSVEVGTLEDDLARRDFRMNAIAKAPDGSLIDPHNGVQDINERVIRAVGSAQDRLREDALRAVRALRFSVTLGFRIDHELMFAMENAFVLDAIRDNISDERIREELNKMLAVDTLGTLSALGRFKDLTTAMFSGSVSLEATMKKRKGR